MENAEALDVRPHLPEKKVKKGVTYMVFLLLGMTFLAFDTLVAEHLLFRNDPFHWKPTSDQLNCSTVAIASGFEKTGLMNFTVTFKHPYTTKVSVSKTPMGEHDRLSILGEKLVWQGTLDLSEGKGMPKAVFAFFGDQTYKKKQNKHFYRVECTTLDLMAEANLKKWKEIDQHEKETRKLCKIFGGIFGFAITGAVFAYVLSLFVPPYVKNELYTPVVN